MVVVSGAIELQSAVSVPSEEKVRTRPAPPVTVTCAPTAENREATCVATHVPTTHESTGPPPPPPPPDELSDPQAPRATTAAATATRRPGCVTGASPNAQAQAVTVPPCGAPRRTRLRPGRHPMTAAAHHRRDREGHGGRGQARSGRARRVARGVRRGDRGRHGTAATRRRRRARRRRAAGRGRRRPRAVGAGGQRRSRVLVQEERTAVGELPAGDGVDELRVTGGDELAAVLVERVGEVVAEAAVLAGRGAGRATLADATGVH